MEVKFAIDSDLTRFFIYLNDHLSDNGVDEKSLFQPLSRIESKVRDGLKQRFEQGMKTPIGSNGWRRLWLAESEDCQIIGHIDIRSHAEANAGHRALLGMGVDRSIRKQGLGSNLLDTVISYSASDTDLEWLDLWVLSSNKAAIGLYQKTGFTKCGELQDMFRIDGFSFSYTLMSRRV